MNINLSRLFIRLFFTFITILFMVTLHLSKNPEITTLNVLVGLSLGLGASALIIGIEVLFRKFSLLTFNTTVLGLLFGYLMSLALLFIFKQLLVLIPYSQNNSVVEPIKILLFLTGIYLGVMMTLKASHELLISLPFVKFTSQNKKTQELLVDPSALCDGRLIDLSASGLLDNRLIVPRFLLKELYEHEESKDELQQLRAKVSFEILRKLETLPDLHLQYSDTDFPEIKETTQKILKLGRLLNADVLTADINRIQISAIDGVRVINLHALSNALKPLMQRGEYLNIKIQRPGKEERQGVGYLEDGTMIVVNGGGDFMGKTVRASVLSVKHTSTGRMVFCNVAEELCEQMA